MSTTTWSARITMEQQAHNDALSTWLRLGCLAWVHADINGHARFGVGQVARVLGLTTQQVSEALVVARGRGWVDTTSTARCIVLPGCGAHPCDERHRQ